MRQRYCSRWVCKVCPNQIQTLCTCMWWQFYKSSPSKATNLSIIQQIQERTKTGRCRELILTLNNSLSLTWKLTYVRIFVIFDDFPEFKVTRHYSELQTCTQNRDVIFLIIAILLIATNVFIEWSNFPLLVCANLRSTNAILLWKHDKNTYSTDSLPEKGSDHVYSLPPYLLPCTEERGHSFPDRSER